VRVLNPGDMSHKLSYYMVNGITWYRLIAAPFLILLIIYQRPDLFKWLLALSFFTDAIDGFLARRYGVASSFGAKLDSVADDFTIVAGVVGAIVFKPEFLQQEIVLVIVMLALLVIQTIYSISRYGKISSFHTYLAKLAAVLQGTFLILLFFLPEPVYFLFYIAAFVTIAELVEEIILVFVLKKWQPNVRGLYYVLKRQPGAG
jgi:cardiolipin synthase (CMP-forming)